MNTFVFLAQNGAPTQPGPPGWTTFIPIILMVVIFYMLILRPKRGEEKKRQQMLGSLKRGDRVQTIGGILGTVMDTKDTEVVLKVDESSNTKMRFARSAIHRVLQEEKAEK